MAKLWTRSWRAIWKEATRSKQMSHIIGIDFGSTNYERKCNKKDDVIIWL